MAKRKIGVVVLAHGSRKKKANEDLLQVVEMLRGMKRWDFVEGAFLQFASPPLDEMVDRLAAAGCEVVVVLPLLLFTGQHVTGDIPANIEKVKRRHPNVEVKYANNIGPDWRLVQIAADRIEEAIRE